MFRRQLDLVGLREEAVSRLGVPAAEILMVGDSLEKDVRGALPGQGRAKSCGNL